MSNWRITGLRDELMTFANATVAPVLNETLKSLGVTEQLNVGWTRLRNSNMPGLWHERRTGKSVGVDTCTSRDDLYIGVMVAARWTDEGIAEEQVDAMLDDVRRLYTRRCAEKLPWGVHRAKRFGVEFPVPTDINGVPVIVAGIVLEVQLQFPSSWPS